MQINMHCRPIYNRLQETRILIEKDFFIANKITMSEPIQIYLWTL